MSDFEDEPLDLPGSDQAEEASKDSEIDFDDELDDDQLPLDELEAEELGVELDDPEEVAQSEDEL